MASKFAALADSEEEGGSDARAPLPAEPQGPAEGAADDDDDGEFLGAFFHNNKASRHLGAIAARDAARRRERREAEAEGVRELAAGVEELELESDEESSQEEGDGPRKRTSKKAERRTQRKQDKAARREQREAGGAGPGDAASADAAGAPGDARAPRGKAKKQKEGEKGKPQRVSEEHAEEGGAAAAGEAEPGEAATASKGKPKKLGKAPRAIDTEADAEKAACADGGVLDARFRKHFLSCPSEIAPVEGCDHVWEIAPGYVPGMRAPARFFADEKIALLCLEEIGQAGGGFLPAVRQLANVATLPGLMGYSLGMPDIHSGYGFAVGSVAAVDLTNPDAVVSPGGVGFDINCGVRLLRTDIKESEVREKKLASLATAIFEAVPAGVGADGAFAPKNHNDLKDALRHGMRWALERGLCWEEDLERTEEKGAMPDADPDAVSVRALRRGSPQLGTLGSGNHYLELQVVDEIFDEEAARAMDLVQGNICVMIHCGSRGLGHQLCTDYLQNMDAAMKKQGISVPDRQLCCVKASSPEGKQYLRGMAAAANFAFVNRTIIAHSVREVFRKAFLRDPKEDLRMDTVYDVSHNIAKQEDHVDPADGKVKPALVHRKGATRSFPPGHEALPEVYRKVGQPVLIGGSMGTCSYVLAGNPQSMGISFGSTCHGAGRRLSRAAAKRELSAPEVLAKLRRQGIEVRVASPKLVAEEADESYKDVSSVVRTCHEVGMSRMVARMRPIAVIKG